MQQCQGLIIAYFLRQWKWVNKEILIKKVEYILSHFRFIITLLWPLIGRLTPSQTTWPAPGRRRRHREEAGGSGEHKSPPEPYAYQVLLG